MSMVFLFVDETLEQVQGDQYSIFGLHRRSHGEGGMSERPAGGAG